MSAIVATRAHAVRRALSLDADAYHSLAFARIEDDAIWTREWICIGVDEDIVGVGDLLPFTAGDHAVHVQRLAGGPPCRSLQSRAARRLPRRAVAMQAGRKDVVFIHVLRAQS